MKCQYCNKVLSSKSSLNMHQRKTKYCLKIQGKNSEELLYKCPCGKKFVRKHHLLTHQESCIISPELNKLRIENQILKSKLEDALRREKELRADYSILASICANKTTTTNNTTNNHLNLGVFDKTHEDIKKIVDKHYDRKYLVQGQKGVAIFTNKHVLKSDGNKPIYIITDHNRGNGKYKVSDTEVVTDPGMSGLTKKVYPIIKKKAIYIVSTDPNPMEDDELMTGYHEVFDMGENNSVFRSMLIKQLSA